MAERVLITGVLGCLGAWVARCVLDDGDDVVGYDLGDARHRLELVLGDDIDRLEIVKGDITELAAVERALDEHEITRVVHLAALQVPFVRANPPLGMHVNVAGTVNVFDAVSRRLDRIPGVMYASSSAIYNASDPSPAPETGGTSPSTLYGVSKLADEGIARVYRRRRRRVVDRPPPLRRLRRRSRPGDDVEPDGGDARRGPRRGLAHRLLGRGAVRLRPRRRAGRGDGSPLVGRRSRRLQHAGRRRRCRRRRGRDPGVRAGGRDHLERRPAAVPGRDGGGRLRPRRRPVPAHAARSGCGGDDRARSDGV